MRIFLILAFVVQAFACQPIAGDRIFGRDLAAASPLFSAVDPELVVGPAPLPGVERVLRGEELLRFAQHNNIALSGPAPEVCFERVTEPLTPEKLLPVLRQALDIEGAQIEILDLSRSSVPDGTLHFTRAGLSTAGLWRGVVLFDQNRTTPVWAKVRVSTEQTWIEAAEPLAAGKPVTSSQLRVAKGPRFPFGPAPVASLDLVIGRAPLRSVKTEEPIFASMLVAPREIERGDQVSVEVSIGSAKLLFEATSESAGRTGEMILIRNPQNGRYFQARVDGKDKVSITK